MAIEAVGNESNDGENSFRSVRERLEALFDRSAQNDIRFAEVAASCSRQAIENAISELKAAEQWERIVAAVHELNEALEVVDVPEGSELDLMFTDRKLVADVVVRQTKERRSRGPSVERGGHTQNFPRSRDDTRRLNRELFRVYSLVRDGKIHAQGMDVWRRKDGAMRLARVQLLEPGFNETAKLVNRWIWEDGQMWTDATIHKDSYSATRGALGLAVYLGAVDADTARTAMKNKNIDALELTLNAFATVGKSER